MLPATIETIATAGNNHSLLILKFSTVNNLLLQGRKVRRPAGYSPVRPSVSIRLAPATRTSARVTRNPIHQATHCVWEERKVVQILRTSESDIDPRITSSTEEALNTQRSTPRQKGRFRATYRIGGSVPAGCAGMEVAGPLVAVEKSHPVFLRYNELSS